MSNRPNSFDERYNSRSRGTRAGSSSVAPPPHRGGGNKALVGVLLSLVVLLLLGGGGYYGYQAGWFSRGASTGAKSVGQSAFEEEPIAAAGAPVQIHAVVVGINDYQDTAVTDLQFAENDAQKFAAALEEYMGLPKENITLLTGANATLQQVKSALGTKLSRRAASGDMAIVYFSCHGSADARGVKSDDGTSKYLMMQDTRSDDLFATGLAMQDVARMLERLQARIKWVCLDTCYSGASGSKSFTLGGMKAAGMSDSYLDQLASSEGTLILTSCKASEVSLESPVLEHGIFTYHLLKGLSGGADFNKNGVVLLSELHGYVAERVERDALQMDGRQHVVLRGEMSGTFPLSRVTH